MTQIDFYTRVPDKLHTACRIVAKAVAARMRVMVLTPDAGTTEELDRLLWSVPATGFIPHVRARHKLAAVTPVLIDHDLAGVEGDELLLNLRIDTPEVFSRFKRLVEIVSLDEDDAAAARERFRLYRDRGYEMRTYNLSSTAG